MSVKLYVGSSHGRIQREDDTLTGERCDSALFSPSNKYNADTAPHLKVLLDSGAFSDKPEKRLSFQGALERQLVWEAKARNKWSAPDWNLHIVASYDYLLIDEKWNANIGAYVKERWDRHEATKAVDVSLAAAEYLASKRTELSPRKLLFGCQGTDAQQYTECAKGILSLAKPGDVFGFGGRCILGRQPKLLQEHFETCIEVLPLIADAGIKDVHIFGVLYERGIAPMAYLCDQLGLHLSTDSTAPIKSCAGLYSDEDVRRKKKRGVRRWYWRENVAWWQNHLTNIHQSKWYRDPTELLKPKQLALFECA